MDKNYREKMKEFRAEALHKLEAENSDFNKEAIEAIEKIGWKVYRKKKGELTYFQAKKGNIVMHIGQVIAQINIDEVMKKIEKSNTRRKP